LPSAETSALDLLGAVKYRAALSPLYNTRIFSTVLNLKISA